jgi:hypothetical protein
MKRLFVIAAIATLATAAQAEEASKSTVAASTTTAASATAPAATVAAISPQTTTATVTQAEAAATSPYSGTFSTTISADAKNLNYGTGGTTFKSVNFVGGSYKLNKDTKLSLRQYFAYDRKPQVVNKTVLMDPTVILTQNFAGGLKSDPVSALFWYYLPTSEASRGANSNGKLRADIEFDWTLSPKWTVGYYLNPRQSLIPTQFKDNTDAETMAEEPIIETSSNTVLIHNGLVSYNLNDNAALYFNLGMMHVMRTRNATLSDESIETAFGVQAALGKVVLVAEIDNSYNLKESFKKAAPTVWTAESTVSYALAGSVAF